MSFRSRGQLNRGAVDNNKAFVLPRRSTENEGIVIMTVKLYTITNS